MSGLAGLGDADQTALAVVGEGFRANSRRVAGGIETEADGIGPKDRRQAAGAGFIIVGVSAGRGRAFGVVAGAVVIVGNGTEDALVIVLHPVALNVGGVQGADLVDLALNRAWFMP